MKGARILLESLTREGCDLVFGYPGGAVVDLYDELLNYPIRHVLVRHEQAAAHAADGYARATGKVGVCFTTSGPGATNLVSGIACAYMDSVPIVAFTGQVSARLLGRDAFQEADLTGITVPITKHNYLVKDVADLARVVKEAFHIASTGRPGPVLVDLPKDVIMGEAEFRPVKRVHLPGYKPTYKGNLPQIAKAANLLNNSLRPVALIGGGVVSSGASDAVTALCEKAEIPIVCTLMGLGGVRSDHHLNFGLVGMHGSIAANNAVQHCDLLIGLGTRFTDRTTGLVEQFAPRAMVIHIDIDPAEIGKNVRVNVPVVGHLSYVIPELLKLVNENDHSEWIKQIKSWQKEPETRCAEPGEIEPRIVLEELMKRVPKNTIVATDVGQHQMWVAQHWKFTAPRRLLSSGGLGCMGYGLPAAVGAQLGKPDHTVILITGDGSFQMNMQELATVKANSLPIKIFLFNNGCLGMVRQWQDLLYHKRYSQVELFCNPDFPAIARAYGLEGRTISSPDEVGPSIVEALTHDGPFLVDIRIPAEQNVYPMVPAGKALDEAILP
ncbi:MAG TPA: biosynthetic-type acetolactate synthase large subunit [Firmicutes bacterium]|nr:biosynthetic-type acetolactate synthase large subunit [Bacillota bacterium]